MMPPGHTVTCVGNVAFTAVMFNANATASVGIVHSPLLPWAGAVCVSSEPNVASDPT